MVRNLSYEQPLSPSAGGPSLVHTGPIRGGSVDTSVRRPENQEGVSESLKGPIALVIDVLILSFFSWIGGGFHLFLVDV